MRRPKLIVERPEFEPDGTLNIPESVFLENTLRVFRERYLASQNPLWVWRAINEMDQHRAVGAECQLPGWVADYLCASARALLQIDPDAVPSTKMPHALAGALRLTKKDGGPGYVRQWNAEMDQLIEVMASPLPIDEATSALLKQQIASAKAPESEKHRLRKLATASTRKRKKKAR